MGCTLVFNRWRDGVVENGSLVVSAVSCRGDTRIVVAHAREHTEKHSAAFVTTTKLSGGPVRLIDSPIRFMQARAASEPRRLRSALLPVVLNALFVGGIGVIAPAVWKTRTMRWRPSAPASRRVSHTALDGKERRPHAPQARSQPGPLRVRPGLELFGSDVVAMLGGRDGPRS